jgi:hypothetical protein
VKTCGVDRGVSAVPIKVYRFKDQLWFKDNSTWKQIAAGLDQVCDVLDIDAQDGNRRANRGGRFCDKAGPGLIRFMRGIAHPEPAPESRIHPNSGSFLLARSLRLRSMQEANSPIHQRSGWRGASGQSASGMGDCGTAAGPFPFRAVALGVAGDRARGPTGDQRLVSPRSEPADRAASEASTVGLNLT